MRCIRISKFGSYQYKHSFEDAEPWKDVVIFDTSSGTNPTVDIKMLAPTKVPIKAAKLKDIAKQLAHIPVPLRPFYSDLLAADVAADAATMDDVEADEHEQDADEVGFDV